MINIMTSNIITKLINTTISPWKTNSLFKINILTYNKDMDIAELSLAQLIKTSSRMKINIMTTNNM
jgi:hypothetical protein